MTVGGVGIVIGAGALGAAMLTLVLQKDEQSAGARAGSVLQKDA